MRPAGADLPLKPIGVVRSLVYFGVPALGFAGVTLWLLPAMVRAGVAPFPTFVVTFVLPLAVMLGAAFVAYRLEGRPWSWPAIRDRMRLGPMSRADWLWTLGLLAATFALQALVGPVAKWFDGVTFYTPPSEFTGFMAGLQRGDFGFDLRGRWDVWLFITLGSLLFNIGGEELWWRGVILPRQELAFRKWAWLVNGLLWNLFHFFYHTNLGSVIGYLPITVPLAFVAQRTRSTWPGIISHFIVNIGLPIGILYGVLGRPIPGGG